jgi:hypothetical protein
VRIHEAPKETKNRPPRKEGNPSGNRFGRQPCYRRALFPCRRDPQGRKKAPIPSPTALEKPTGITGGDVGEKIVIGSIAAVVAVDRNPLSGREDIPVGKPLDSQIMNAGSLAPEPDKERILGPAGSPQGMVSGDSGALRCSRGEALHGAKKTPSGDDTVVRVGERDIPDPAIHSPFHLDRIVSLLAKAGSLGNSGKFQPQILDAASKAAG